MAQRLHQLVEKYFEVCDEYEKVKPIIAKHTKLQGDIKKCMKDLGITECKIDKGDEILALAYSIGYAERVDISIMPDDIKETYTRSCEVWRETKMKIKKD